MLWIIIVIIAVFTAARLTHGNVVALVGSKTATVLGCSTPNTGSSKNSVADSIYRYGLCSKLVSNFALYCFQVGQSFSKDI